MTLPTFDISNISDQFVQENFSKFVEFLRNEPYLNGDFTLITGTITGNVSSQKFRHNLKFIPKDAILTSAIWSGTIGVLTFLNASFDSENIMVKTTGLSSTETVTFRALIGRIPG